MFLLQWDGMVYDLPICVIKVHLKCEYFRTFFFRSPLHAAMSDNIKCRKQSTSCFLSYFKAKKENFFKMISNTCVNYLIYRHGEQSAYQCFYSRLSKPSAPSELWLTLCVNLGRHNGAAARKSHFEQKNKHVNLTTSPAHNIVWQVHTQTPTKDDTAQAALEGGMKVSNTKAISCAELGGRTHVYNGLLCLCHVWDDPVRDDEEDEVLGAVSHQGSVSDRKERMTRATSH